MKAKIINTIFVFIIFGESRGGRPGLPVPNKPDGFCGRKATLNRRKTPRFLLTVLGGRF